MAPTETELKLGVDPKDAVRLLRHPFLKQHTRGRARSQPVHSVYYDTPDLDLWRRRLTLRLRRVGKHWVQTVKGGGAVNAGLHQRREWEIPVAGPEPDFPVLAGSELAGLLADPAIRDRLAPAFVTEFTRTTRLLELAPGECVEFCFDRGSVSRDGQQIPLCEIELELKSGNAAQLFDLALAIQEIVPVRVENRSKAERGYALARPDGRVPVKATAPELAPEMDSARAFRAIVANCLSHWQANEPGFLEDGDAECLHQLRVAIRRLRSALALAPEPPSVRDELAWLGGALGPARDWSVMAGETLPPILAAFPDHEPLRRLAEQVAALGDEAAADAKAALRSPRCQLLKLNLGRWLVAPPAEQGAPIGEFAAELIEKSRRRLAKRGRRLAKLAPEERHRARIAAKKLRYAAEFFAALYPTRATRAYIDALSRLQDDLGILNDAAATERLLAQADPAGEPAGIVRGWGAAQAAFRIGQVKKHWKRWRAARRFW